MLHYPFYYKDAASPEKGRSRERIPLAGECIITPLSDNAAHDWLQRHQKVDVLEKKFKDRLETV